MSFSFLKPDQVEVEVELEEWDSILEKKCRRTPRSGGRRNTSIFYSSNPKRIP